MCGGLDGGRGREKANVVAGGAAAAAAAAAVVGVASIIIAASMPPSPLPPPRPNPLSAKPLAEAPAVVALLVFGDFGKGGRASSSSWL